ncbi:MAG: 50S ribosomal protein L11 methyltransferase [Clostridia bacterium]
MIFNEIAISTTTEASELVADILESVTGEGVCIYDKNDLNIPQWDYVEDGLMESYGEEVIVKGFCIPQKLSETLNAVKSPLQNITLNKGSLSISIGEIDGDEWVTSWKKYFLPIDIGNIVVCPKWLTPTSEQSAKTVVYLDTGIAFGTGQHETTSMCLSLMQQNNFVGKSVLDVGCGSGILGITAGKLGAKEVLLIDIDKQASDIATENIATNKLADICSAKCGDLVKDVNKKYDFVLANLTADILKFLSVGIASVAYSGTVVILSGILSTRLQEVVTLYTDIGLNFIQALQKGEWSACIFKVN